MLLGIGIGVCVAGFIASFILSRWTRQILLDLETKKKIRQKKEKSAKELWARFPLTELIDYLSRGFDDVFYCSIGRKFLVMGKSCPYCGKWLKGNEDHVFICHISLPGERFPLFHEPAKKAISG